MKIKFFLTLIMVAVFSNTSYADSTADMAARLACLPASQNISSIFIKYTRGEISKEEAVKKINNEIDFSKNKLSFKGGIGIERRKLYISDTILSELLDDLKKGADEVGNDEVEVFINNELRESILEKCASKLKQLYR